MNREEFKEYKKRFPYHVWVRRGGTKFVGHFKNRAQAFRWAGNHPEDIGKVTTAAKTVHKKRKRRMSEFGGLGNFGGMGGGSWGF